MLKLSCGWNYKWKNINYKLKSIILRKNLFPQKTNVPVFIFKSLGGFKRIRRKIMATYHLQSLRTMDLSAFLMPLNNEYFLALKYK